MKKQKTQSVIKKYVTARKGFLNYAKNEDSLSGSDNIIGRIGEYIAFEYLNLQNRNPIKAVLNRAGYDIVCDNKDKIEVSVKLISNENKKGRTTKIGESWNELIVILLDENYEIQKLGHISKKEFDSGINNNDFKGAYVYASRTMVNEDGIITKYGNVIESRKELKKIYTLI
ncbi:MAG: hypothetical protein K8R54_02290 [Bacteroidales bacterium]|nr:hypothetical protein [Bacteroidales bacterium]